MPGEVGDEQHIEMGALINNASTAPAQREWVLGAGSLLLKLLGDGSPLLSLSSACTLHLLKLLCAATFLLFLKAP